MMNERSVMNMMNKPMTIEQGVSLLDKHFCGRYWVDKINLDTLDMKKGSLCILGQLFGDYSSGKRIIGCRPFSVFSGRNLSPLGDSTSEWKQAINQMKAELDPYESTNQQTVTNTKQTSFHNKSNNRTLIIEEKIQKILVEFEDESRKWFTSDNISQLSNKAIKIIRVV